MARDLVLHISIYDKGSVAVKDLTAKVEGLEKATWSLGKTLNRVFVASTFLTILNKFKEGITKTIDEVTKFENTTRRIEGVAGISGKSLSKLSQQSIDLSNATEFMATEVQSATLALVKLGIPAVAASKMLPILADITTATGLEMGRVSVIVLDIMRQFSLDFLNMAEVQRTANVLFQVEAQTSIESFEEIADSMKYVATVANTMGYSLEETSSILGILANRGIKGTLAGNAMKNMFLNILSATGKTKQVLIGMNTETMSFADILAELEARGVDVIGFLELFKKRAVVTSLAVAASSKEVNEFTKELEEQTLKVSDVAAVIRYSWINQLKILENTFVNLGATWQLIMDNSFTVNPVTQLIESFISLQKWMLENKELIIVFSNNIAKSLKNVADVIGFLVSKGVINFRFLSASIKILIANSILFNKNFVAGNKVMLKFNETVKATGKGTALGSLLVNWNMYALALFGTIEILNVAFDKWNARLDKQTATVADTSLEGMKSKLAALKEYQSLKYKPEEKQQFIGEFGDVSKNAQKASAEIVTIAEKYNLPLKFFENIDLIKIIPGLEKSIKEVEQIIKDSNDRIAQTKLDKENTLALQLKQAAIEEARKRAQAWIDAYIDYLNNRSEGIKDAYARILAGIHPIEPRLLSEGEKTQGIGKETLKSLKTKEVVEGSNLTDIKDVGLKISDLPKNIQKQLEMVVAVKLVLEEKEIEKLKKEVEKLREKLEGKKEKEKEAKGKVVVAHKKSQDTNKEILDITYKDILDHQDKVVAAYELTDQIITGFDDLRHDKIMNNITKEENALNKKYSKQMDLAKNSSERQKLVQMKYDADMRKLQKRKEKEEVEYRNKEKAWAIIDVLIKGAVAFIAQLQSGPAGWVLAALTAAATTASAIFIASKKYREGGMVRGAGNGTSDSVPMWGSNGEYMVKKDIVDSLGGEYGVKSMIEDRLGKSFTSSRNVNLYIDTLIGSPEYERDLFIRLKKEEKRW